MSDKAGVWIAARGDDGGLMARLLVEASDLAAREPAPACVIGDADALVGQQVVMLMARLVCKECPLNNERGRVSKALCGR